MKDINNIDSILDAINEINSEKKPLQSNSTVTKNSIPKLNKESEISPEVDRLIREAEIYKKKLSSIDFEINDSKNKKKYSIHKDVLILRNEVVESPNILNDTIDNLKKKIKNLQDVVVKLRLQLIDLKQDKLPLNNNEEGLEIKNHNNFVNVTKGNLNSIYKQVEKQKKIFLDLKNTSTKIKNDSSVYKENYERLIIENNDIKTRLMIAKEQIVNYEDNKLDLLTAFNQLNEILSKTNIVRNISKEKLASEKNILQKINNTETSD